MYMALHIADSEVSQLAAKLAELDKTSKTESLRRLLRRELEERERRERRKTFHEVATEIIREARAKQIKPPTKEEIDEMWGQ